MKTSISLPRLGEVLYLSGVPNFHVSRPLICFTVTLISLGLKETASSKCNLRVTFFSTTSNSFFISFSPCAMEDNNDKDIFVVLYLHMYHTKTVQSGSFGIHVRSKIELQMDWTKGDLICNAEISLQRPLHDSKRTLKQSELQITEKEKPLSPPSKCIASQKRLN